METKAKIRNTGVRILITVLCILLFKVLFEVSQQFADFYFHRFYVSISICFRTILGKIPFSIGDVIYVAWIITAGIFLLKLCYNIFKTKWYKVVFLLLKGILAILGLYLAFLILWGYNYSRQSLETDMKLEVTDYNTDQLYRLTDTLLQRVNNHKIALGDSLTVTHPGPDSAQLFQQAVAAYQLAAAKWPSVTYKYPCIKPSLYGKWLNYMNVGGYLNPFTAEAQVNITTPGFLHPFTICHEVAHQVGYAPEEEANFVGYLVANNFPNEHFRYAANFEMFMYSIRQLGREDTTLAGQLWRRTVPGVKADLRYLRAFNDQYRGRVDDYTAIIYDQYLKANKQEKGIRSYSEVVGWLIAYFRIK
ncbi:Protein of unknown function [Chitinophaga sp. CF118]|uniref:DUF3810 domain-containing protein n=1 Tax=Chitinophaga sp. CF118 TaxID=1884367 RepID=UPI0008F44DCC|nr:DUF3810 domain-containing protein [Chitinophaga sp. CF118]SFE85572.1 Protein of unknown function [Chitinophaga sp. CF118]